jgi:hypothetical protein
VDEFHTDAMQLYHRSNELAERCEDIKRWQSVRIALEESNPDEL